MSAPNTPDERSSLHDSQSSRDSASNSGAAHNSEAPSISDSPGLPRLIGPYRLMRKLGEGGMGQVWLALQVSPVRREVALKLIRGGMFHSSALQRFEAERQSLAIMDHPAIAKVFDAGTTLDDQPYFVMEYVPGLPISRYCDEKKLSIPQRLELFIRVCEGVQHAHQKAIIHRDLKPSNILVVEIDGKPLPRIIDFGIAKSVTDVESSGERTFITKLGALVGTPGYMSPEQADPTCYDVDTRTDVYSLGVVLYELLTGSLPFEPAVWKQPFDQALRQLREDDPPSPSTRLRKAASTLTGSAGFRGIEPTHLVSMLEGDLDWISMKALARERERRYGSPSEFAADVSRYLNNEPVLARPASAAYKVRKYVQRHKLVAAFAGTIFTLLIAFGVAQYVQLRKITRERDRADRVAKFMVDMFRVSDPNESRGNAITAREVLDKASADIESSLISDPLLQANLMHDMGHAYLSLGLFPQAQGLLEKSIAKGRQAAGSSDPVTAKAMATLGYLYLRQGRYAEAEALLRESVRNQEKALGPSDLSTFSAKRNLAFVLEDEGKFEEGEKTAQTLYVSERKVLGASHWETLLTANLLANLLDDLKRLPEAEQLYRETMKLQQETMGIDHPDTLTTASNLAGVLEEQGKFEEAEKLQRQTLLTRTRVLGADHPDTLAVKLNLANTLEASGRNADAETVYRETLSAQQRVLGKDNPDGLMTEANLANLLRKTGRYSEAEASQREVLARRQKILGPGHPETIKSVEDLASTLFAQKKPDEAGNLYRSLVDSMEKAKNTVGVANAWYDFACAAALAGRTDEAFSNLRQAINHGYADAAHIAADNDLKSLRGDSRFDVLVSEARSQSSGSNR